MRGKIAVILINDPDFETGDDRGFGGRAMTYYGRWTYKFEEAGRQGAAGAIIIHETAPAAYPWAVIQSSTGSARWDIVRADRGASRAGFEGWITNEVAMETFRRARLDFNELKSRAQRPGFRAVRMNLTGSLHLETSAEATHHLQCRRRFARHGAPRRNRHLYRPLGPSRPLPASGRRRHLQRRLR